MKTFNQFVSEDMPANSASGGGVASIGVGENGEPPGKTKKTKRNNSLLFKRAAPK